MREITQITKQLEGMFTVEKLTTLHLMIEVLKDKLARPVMSSFQEEVDLLQAMRNYTKIKTAVNGCWDTQTTILADYNKLQRFLNELKHKINPDKILEYAQLQIDLPLRLESFMPYSSQKMDFKDVLLAFDKSYDVMMNISTAEQALMLRDYIKIPKELNTIVAMPNSSRALASVSFLEGDLVITRNFYLDAWELITSTEKREKRELLEDSKHNTQDKKIARYFFPEEML